MPRSTSAAQLVEHGEIRLVEPDENMTAAHVLKTLIG